MVNHLAAGFGLLIGGVALIKDLWGRPAGDWGPTFVYRMTGYDMSQGTWRPQDATAGLPIACGVGISYVAAKTGINRYTPKHVNL